VNKKECDDSIKTDDKVSSTVLTNIMQRSRESNLTFVHANEFWRVKRRLQTVTVFLHVITNYSCKGLR